MISRSTVLTTTLVGAAFSVGPLSTSHPPSFIWNASASVPIGLYRVLPIAHLAVPDLVVAAPPEPLARFLADGGYLPRGVPLLKRIAALPGHAVCRSGSTVSVDGTAIGEARGHDGRGRPLPVWQGCRVLAADEIFLMNPQSADSLDGRYFGPLPRASIIGRAEPLWTMKER